MQTAPSVVWSVTLGFADLWGALHCANGTGMSQRCSTLGSETICKCLPLVCACPASSKEVGTTLQLQENEESSLFC